MRLKDFSFGQSLHNKLTQDVLWNLFSLVILGVAGVAINIVLGRIRGPAALGVFNQVFAFYIMYSQFAVGGVQLSVLKYVSCSTDQNEVAKITVPALILSTLLGFLVCAVAAGLAPLFEYFHESKDVTLGLYTIIPGIFLFAINKVLLSALNAVRQMKAFAVYQALRYLFITGAICVLLAIKTPDALIAQSLSIAEAMLFLILIAHVEIKVCKLRLSSDWLRWLVTHFHFGFKGFLSGVLVECNTRVDILMLGFFMNDATVGVYSFAAIIVEGFAQFPYIVRRNIDPLIGGYLAKGDSPAYLALYSKVRKRFLPIMAATTLVAILAYPAVLRFFVNDARYQPSIWVFIILMSGLLMSSGLRPMMGTLLQSGYPGANTILFAIVISSNIVLNLIFIPFFGMYGAALATGIVFNIEVLLLSVMVWRRLHIALSPIR